MIKRKQIYLIVVSFAAMVVMPWGVIQPRALDDIRNFAFDAFQRQSPRAYDPNAPVRVIGIDEESLASYGQWPWPRGCYALCIMDAALASMMHAKAATCRPAKVSAYLS
jgi:CHASE2 domain-containing sensor protein